MKINFRIQLVILAMLLLNSAMIIAQETAKIGVSTFSPDINLVTSQDDVARFVRAAIFEGLTAPIYENDQSVGENKTALAIADAMTVSHDFLNWAFRLRKGVYFHNHSLISTADIVESLRDCKKQGTLERSTKFSVRIPGSLSQSSEDWIEINLNPDSESKKELSQLPNLLTGNSCPIFPVGLRSSFGDYWGRGNNIVGSGEFRLSTFKAGNRLVLKRFPEYYRSRSKLSTIELIAFDSEQLALRSLRLGNISAMFSNETSVLENAQRDETLFISECPINRVIHRKNFRVVCEPTLNISQWGPYDSSNR